MMCMREFHILESISAQEDEGGGGGSSNEPQAKGLEKTVVCTLSSLVGVNGKAPRSVWCAAIVATEGALLRMGL